MSSHGFELVVVANRLPVERAADGTGWQPSPGGLVTALKPVVEATDGTWIGWSGTPDEDLEPFRAGGLRLVPVALSAEEAASYYEGFANSTLWPLYHDAIAPPQFERRWWDAYRLINARFAEATAAAAGDGATVWVQDYQLQLVPALLRQERPDVRIGFFNHIPFPGYEIYSQLSWRRQVVEGLLGSDLIGFQRHDDAANFLRAVRKLTDFKVRGSTVEIASPTGDATRPVRVGTYPISVDAQMLDELARRPDVVERSQRLRRELGDPQILLLGVDRLDYTKGILQRLRAYGELLDQNAFEGTDITMVQVASPSRERVDEYQRLRNEVEVVVGRINGDHSRLGTPALHYLHQSFPIEEMAAMYLATDVMLVTPLRDGMNLVAKEFIACRNDNRGVLVLSEFTGAADELRQALLINPYDIDATKQAILDAVHLPKQIAGRRMRALRRRVLGADVHHWAKTFLDALQHPEASG
jgi:alpha,alpha-trehalose-phosphate synthase [UDP-forming]